jgi:folate-binding protein YgfZ
MSTWAAQRPSHGAVVVSGPDATSFLQSIVSQDLEPLRVGEGVRSLLLTPNGKVDVVLRMLLVDMQTPMDAPPAWWLDCDAGFGERLAASLDRYRIRVDVEIRDRSDAWGLLEVRGHEAVPRVAAAAHLEVPDADCHHVAWGDRRVVRADWPDRAGVDVLGPIDSVRAARDELLHAGVAPVAPGEHEAARIEAGVPLLGVDVDDRTIPQEAFLERDAVSFTKGCFLGQELVCRIDTRGHVNRFLRRLDIAGTAVPERGAEVVSGDAIIGTVTSAAAVPGASRVVALAMVRREVDPPADVAVRWDSREVSASVQSIPEPGS